MINPLTLRALFLWIFAVLAVFAIFSCTPKPRDAVMETSEVLDVLKCDSGKCVIKHTCGIDEIDSPIVRGTIITRILDTESNRRWHARYNLGKKYDKEVKCTTR